MGVRELTVISIDVVLLAGGRSSRMGQDKASLAVAGRRLIDHLLDDLVGWPHLGRTVVVAPVTLAVPDWALQTMEDPPGGGPVAGIFAGLAALEAADADHVLVLTCDAPKAARLAPMLFAAAQANPDADGVLAVADGRAQYLLAAYRVSALRAGLRLVRPTGAAHGVSMHRLVSGLATTELTVPAELAIDLDDRADVERWLGVHSQ